MRYYFETSEYKNNHRHANLLVHIPRGLNNQLPTEKKLYSTIIDIEKDNMKIIGYKKKNNCKGNISSYNISISDINTVTYKHVLINKLFFCATFIFIMLFAFIMIYAKNLIVDVVIKSIFIFNLFIAGYIYFLSDSLMILIKIQLNNGTVLKIPISSTSYNQTEEHIINSFICELLNSNAQIVIEDKKYKQINIGITILKKCTIPLLITSALSLIYLILKNVIKF